jgi:GNAT superfamily N-acetyltransferase
VRYAEGDRLAPAEYRALRAAAGWSDPDLDDAALERALASTWNVTAREDDGDLIGMGRVQDDGLYASIWDMIVLPEHRGRGIGGAIFERMLAHCRGRSLLALVATPYGAPMYRAAGFSEESRGSVALFLRDVP